MLGNQPFLVNLSFSLREWLSKPAERTNTIVLLNAGPTGQERVSALAPFHFIKEKEPFPGVGEHGLCQPQLPGEFPEPAVGRLISQQRPHQGSGLPSGEEGLRKYH